MRVVGLTGGIASGKSTVSKELRDGSGLPVVDADKIARAALRKNTPGYKRVLKIFGKGILLPDGNVDREKLGNIVFADPAQRKLLDRALGPVIARTMLWDVLKHWIAGTPVLVLDVPLLFETGMDRYTSPVVVVWVDADTEEERLIARDGLSQEQARNRINSQRSLDWKREKADIVIDNSGSLELTQQQIQEFVEKITTAPLSWKEMLCSRNFVGSVVAVAIASSLCWRLCSKRDA
ncbi:hypothetical protein SELMODRAFT_180228 [Selaginella moellendorffii]|uniref:Dephospho-CoA kinase n=1 Tax=Selaginella moellendorffii TaxID=88036 RepID=D8SJH9_SELML|nr:dephospho-CoA kinase [Selaginella moellendorffii]EFJ15455.1 hypothetical protein SELMODRAFT_180228 [Selaginella moellendorffii]|eukprot:XP_002983554.1 dephospho-CoA kinase [Selaginella moellendorffii]